MSRMVMLRKILFLFVVSAAVGPTALLMPEHPEQDLQEAIRRMKHTLANIQGDIDHFKARVYESDLPLRRHSLVHFRDCADVYMSGERSSGVYLIRPLGWETIGSFHVFCDMDTDGGGWTVFQRRGDFGFPEEYFHKTWSEYRNGFGDLDKEFWLGNDRIHVLSSQRDSELRIELTDMDGNRTVAKYCEFKVDSFAKKYKLKVEGYSGNAGNSFKWHSNVMFSTRDRDNDEHEKINCSEVHKGGWWFWRCLYSNLNGHNLKGSSANSDGVQWSHWRGANYSLYSEMKMRPRSF